jgi:hypothetical protein
VAVAQRLRRLCDCGTPDLYPQTPGASAGEPGIGHNFDVRTISPADLGLRSTHLRGLSLASIGLCIGLWSRAKTIGEDERGNAERRALFVGLWAPMFWLMADSLRRAETERQSLFARAERRRR